MSRMAERLARLQRLIEEQDKVILITAPAWVPVKDWWIAPDVRVIAFVGSLDAAERRIEELRQQREAGAEAGATAPALAPDASGERTKGKSSAPSRRERKRGHQSVETSQSESSTSTRTPREC